ncbi:DUF2510 domain-containing protein [Curtobacterium ammoniigenes]|uniref:DUF2510 domain-containing protein n=1 Tax=Curtobacterium ammoniigenes TaxID=395387 RepID=UPI000AFDA4D5|nr:DUF2510 domain-containing protein [Curtobacterium ammoniigenes]
MTLPEAGWFPDPQNADRLRWWDGRTWSEATQAAPARDTVVSVTEAHHTPAFSVTFAGSAASDTGRRGVSATGARASAAGTIAAADDWSANGNNGDWRTWDAPPRRLSVFSWCAVMLAVAAVVFDPYGAVAGGAAVLAVIGLIYPHATGRWRMVSRSLALSAFVLAASEALVAVHGTTPLLAL